MATSLEQSYSTALWQIKKAIAQDPDYAWTWQSNLAVCYMDEGATHQQANLAAARFMSTAFNFDVTKLEQWNGCEARWNQQQADKVQSWIDKGQIYWPAELPQPKDNVLAWQENMK